ncbi:MAG: thymidine phosphorylase [Spirochaetota bacterium]
MRAVDVIMKKRSGEALNREELATIINGYVDGSVPDYQVSAWAMAVFFKGMTPAETALLTELMLNSGKRMDLSGLPGPFIDKHSTGGVGDKVSLILAPLAACLGLQVPMMSGRALGHTGGTHDKLESIPGYRTGLTERDFREGIRKDGFAMTGQTAEIVPADKKLYALRDVTATVESIPLITASILSKKVAEGAQALVFDVKSGPGAFMKTPEDAERLAESLVRTGAAMGKRIIAVITDMSEPLGLMVGNFLEIEETLDCLEGRGAADLMAVTLRLTAWMLVAGGKAATVEAGIALCETELASGRPRQRFLDNVVTQGGDAGKLLSLRGTWRSPYSFELCAAESGFIASIDAFKIGLSSVHLGVGRDTAADSVAPDAGFAFIKKRGDPVTKGELIATVYGRDAASLVSARPLSEAAISITATAPDKKSLIIKEIQS